VATPLARLRLSFISTSLLVARLWLSSRLIKSDGASLFHHTNIVQIDIYLVLGNLAPLLPNAATTRPPVVGHCRGLPIFTSEEPAMVRAAYSLGTAHLGLEGTLQLTTSMSLVGAPRHARAITFRQVQADFV